MGLSEPFICGISGGFLDRNDCILVVLQLLIHVRLLATQWIAAHEVSLSFTIYQSLLKLMSIDSVIPSHPLSPLFPTALCLSQHKELALHVRWSRYWSFSMSPSNEYSGLISFRID